MMSLQLCYLVPIMLPPTNYAQNYASIIEKALLTTELVQLFLHENQFGMRVVPDPFPPRAGDVIHPVLRLVRGRLTRLLSSSVLVHQLTSVSDSDSGYALVQL